jgi:hypothetical protein
MPRSVRWVRSLVARGLITEAGTDPVEPAQLQKEKPFAALAKLKLKPRNEP